MDMSWSLHYKYSKAFNQEKRRVVKKIKNKKRRKDVKCRKFTLEHFLSRSQELHINNTYLLLCSNL